MERKEHHSPELLRRVRELTMAGQTEEAWEALAQPLHEALYERQDFSFLDELPPQQQLVLAFDYVQTQVGQGGFIQLIQNGYTSLLVTVIEALQQLHIADNMIAVLDDVLKVYVLNRDALSKETSVAEFSKLYSEFREFEDLETRFSDLLPAFLETVIHIVASGK